MTFLIIALAGTGVAVVIVTLEALSVICKHYRFRRSKLIKNSVSLKNEENLAMSIFSSIPLECINNIRYFLDANSLIQSKMTNRGGTLGVRNVQILSFDDLDDVRGESYGHFNRVKYTVKVPVYADACVLRMIYTCSDFYDQGWGNTKGHIITQLVRDTEVIAETSKPLGIAPHIKTTEKQSKEMDTNEAVLTQCRPGDTFEFQRIVGGGGGHRLTLKNFKIYILFGQRIQ